jgi:hypothetical protein
MTSRVTLTAMLAAVMVGGVLLIPAASARLVADATPADAGLAGMPANTADAADTVAQVAESPQPPVGATLHAAPVSVAVDGFLSWALLDRTTGEIGGSANLLETNSTESMIKIWIVADYLRELGDQELSTDLQQEATLAIRDSDDDATNRLYYAAGGDVVLDRMIKMCGLEQTHPVVPPGERYIWWSYTQMSARDAVLLGECVVNGTAAGPRWTDWVLAEMTQVRGTTAGSDQRTRSGGGRWGIVDGLPLSMLDRTDIGIKNGWTMLWSDMTWRVNCLAVSDDWVLAVMTRYPGTYDLDYGAALCRDVASQLVTAHVGASIKLPADGPPAVPAPES